MNNTMPIVPDNSHLVWLLIKAWVIAILAFSMLFAAIFVLEMDFSLPTATILKVVVTYVMATLFMLLSTTLFSFPMMVITGAVAYLFHAQIWRNPRISILVWSVLGFIIYRISLHHFGEITDVGLFEWVFGYAITREGIATLIALIIAARYFCFGLRKHMMRISEL